MQMKISNISVFNFITYYLNKIVHKHNISVFFNSVSTKINNYSTSTPNDLYG